MMDKKEERESIRQEIMKLNLELVKIDRDLRLKFYKTVVGKYFRYWYDVSDSYTLYLKVIELDNFDILYGQYFKIYYTGDVCFSEPGNVVSINQIVMDIEEMDEITEEQYNNKYQSIINVL